MTKIPVGFIRREPYGDFSEDIWWTEFTAISYQADGSWEDVEAIITEWGGKYCFNEYAGVEWIEFEDEKMATAFLLRWT